MKMASHHNSSTAQFMPYNVPRLRTPAIKHINLEGTFRTEIMLGPIARKWRLDSKSSPKDADIHFGSDAGLGTPRNRKPLEVGVRPGSIACKTSFIIQSLSRSGSRRTIGGPLGSGSE
jgi:hypothetical protein